MNIEGQLSLQIIKDLELNRMKKEEAINKLVLQKGMDRNEAAQIIDNVIEKYKNSQNNDFLNSSEIVIKERNGTQNGIDKFQLNEEQKRLESNSKICTYCKKTTIDDSNDAVYIPVYSVNNRTNLVIYKSVKYQSINVGVPRCKSCIEIHTYDGQKSSFFASFFAAITVLISTGIFGFEGFLYGLIVGGCVYLIIYYEFKHKRTKKHNILTFEEGVEQDKDLHELLSSGWSLTEPRV